MIEATRKSTCWCSLVPLNGPAIVTTSGLRWNLDKSTLNFEGLISTSNEFDGNSYNVVIESNKSILWSMKDVNLKRDETTITTATTSSTSSKVN